MQHLRPQMQTVVFTVYFSTRIFPALQLGRHEKNHGAGEVALVYVNHLHRKESVHYINSEIQGRRLQLPLLHPIQEPLHMFHPRACRHIVLPLCHLRVDAWQHLAAPIDRGTALETLAFELHKRLVIIDLAAEITPRYSGRHAIGGLGSPRVFLLQQVHVAVIENGQIVVVLQFDIHVEFEFKQIHVCKCTKNLAT